MINNNLLDVKNIAQLANKLATRKALTEENLLCFSAVYFPHYFSYSLAPFQYEMIDIASDEKCELAVMITFRGSGKSTILSTINPLWQIMGKAKRKHIVLISQTQEQARAHIKNIKAELENNDLLRNDLGPFKEISDSWTSMSLEFTHYKAKITALSVEQSKRGLRYRQHRPDMIICDDLEDYNSTMTKESRKKLAEAYSSEIAPLGDIGTRILMVGNYLHPNSLLTTLRDKIIAGDIRGRNMFVPLIDDNKQIAWPQKFVDFSEITKLKEKVANEKMWQLEYLLRSVADEDQFLSYQDIAYYHELPEAQKACFKYRILAVDPAISTGNKADYTAIVSASVYKIEYKWQIYLEPFPINKRMNFIESQKCLFNLSEQDPNVHVLIESTAYQRSLIEQLKENKVDAFAYDTKGISKQERLLLASNYIRNQKVYFPENGCTDLINQLVNFSSEAHDDLADAATMLILYVMELASKDMLPKGINYCDLHVFDIDESREQLAKEGRRNNFFDDFLDNDPLGWNKDGSSK